MKSFGRLKGEAQQYNGMSLWHLRSGPQFVSIAFAL